jgi:valyl-tRNA synthetase
MPFVTEELWQRLNRRQGDATISITKARFPVEDSSYNNDEADKEFDLVFSIIKAARSLMVEYTITKNAKGKLNLITSKTNFQHNAPLRQVDTREDIWANPSILL